MKKIKGKCSLCSEPIVLGEMTLWNDGNYYCANCQIDLNKGKDFLDILRKRRAELLNQLYDIDVELDIDSYRYII